jgi:hypothetical protein
MPTQDHYCGIVMPPSLLTQVCGEMKGVHENVELAFSVAKQSMQLRMKGPITSMTVDINNSDESNNNNNNKVLIRCEVEHKKSFMFEYFAKSKKLEKSGVC